MEGFRLMASVADVKYGQMKYEENRTLGEGIRKQQEGLDQKRNRMGWGRSAGSMAGTLLGAAFGPIGIAAGAGFGSWLGSTLGGATVDNVDEVEKGKLFKHSADEARKQGIAAQDQMKSMAVTSALTDAASAFMFAGTDLGQAVQSGAQTGASSVGPGSNLLQRAFAGAKGGVGGGYGHIKAGLQAIKPTTGVDITTKETIGLDEVLQDRVLSPDTTVLDAQYSAIQQEIADKAVNEAASKNVIPGALEKISKNYPGLDEITGAAKTAVDPSTFTYTPLDPYSWHSGASQGYRNPVLDAVNNTAGPTQSFSDFRASGVTPPLEDQNAIQRFFGKHFVMPKIGFKRG
jgi:hypothetical protein